jgi:hypothetical protein
MLLAFDYLFRRKTLAPLEILLATYLRKPTPDDISRRSASRLRSNSKMCASSTRRSAKSKIAREARDKFAGGENSINVLVTEAHVGTVHFLTSLV